MAAEQQAAVRNRSLVMGYFEAIRAKEFQRAANEIMHPDFVFNAPGFPRLHGPREWAALTESFYANSPQLGMTIHDQVADENTVMTHLSWDTVHEHEFHGMAPTGKKLVVGAVTVQHIKDGRIVEEWVYDDYLGLMRQLGAIPLAFLQDTMDVPGNLGVHKVEVLTPR